MKQLMLRRQKIPNRTWASLLIFVIITVIILTSIINYTVNPYSTFKQDETCKIDCKKKHLISDRMTKFYRFKDTHAQTIIMGTSRSGLFSSSILDPYAPKPIFNFSLAGSTIEEQAAYIEFSILQGEVKHVLWALDFFSFNPTKPLHPDFKYERLATDLYWPDYIISLFNFGTLKNSLLTFKENYPFTEYERNQLTKESTNSLREQTFSQKELAYTINHTLKEYAREKSFLNSTNMRDPRSLITTLQYIQKIIDICEHNHVILELYTSPVYKGHMNMYKQIGLYESFVFWKRSLAKMQEYTDFALCNSITNNKENFRDSSHIIGKYGDLIVQTIYESSMQDPTDSFGIHITSDNVEQHLKMQYKKCVE